MQVHLVDGTYELYRQHFGQATRHSDPPPFAGTIGVLTSTIQLLQDGATHIGVATDHVIESFRNDLYDGYKTSEGMEPVLLEQIPIPKVVSYATEVDLVEEVLEYRAGLSLILEVGHKIFLLVSSYVSTLHQGFVKK